MSNLKLIKNSNRTLPSIGIDNPKFIYRKACETDVRETWKKYGWRSVEEDKKITEQTLVPRGI